MLMGLSSPSAAGDFEHDGRLGADHVLALDAIPKPKVDDGSRGQNI